MMKTSLIKMILTTKNFSKLKKIDWKKSNQI